MSDPWYIVEIEIKRVQTWLFSMPVLRAMVGANTLLGETLRGRVCKGPSLRFMDAEEHESLPALVGQVRGGQPFKAPKELLEAVKKAPKPDQSLAHAGVSQDDPGGVAVATGILSRDGGHFDVVFESPEQARSFAEQARDLLVRRLPGLAADIRWGPFGDDDRRERLPRPDSVPLDLPQAETCQLSGNDVATVVYPLTDTESWRAGWSATMRLEAGKRFDNGNSADVLGLMRESILKESGQRQFPTDFEALGPSGFIAVVHVDGNGIGARLLEAGKQAASNGPWARWMAREKAAFQVRSCYRRALLGALGALQKQQRVPLLLRPLMLGGDDLVLVCEASLGLPLVCELARQVEGEGQTAGGRPDRDAKRVPAFASQQARRDTFGAGVAIVPRSFPFHRAHDLAEELTQSAKRLGAALGDHRRSTADWILVTESWHGAVGQARREQYLRATDAELLVLSRRPYVVLGEHKGGTACLSRLLDTARTLLDGGGGGAKASHSTGTTAELLDADRYTGIRSALKGLVDVLPAGRTVSKLHASELDPDLTGKLARADILQQQGSGLWRELSQPGNDHKTAYATSLLDLTEAIELLLLAKQSRPTKSSRNRRKGAPHG